MFGNYVYEKSSAQYEDKILLIDDECLEETTNYSADFLTHGFEVVRYKDDLSFRLEYEEKVKDGEDKIVVIAKSDSYVPYDAETNENCIKLEGKYFVYAYDGTYGGLHGMYEWCFMEGTYTEAERYGETVCQQALRSLGQFP